MLYEVITIWRRRIIIIIIIIIITRRRIRRIRRIIREEFKSKFFLRRIDLDLAKDMLPINAEQAYHETESYEQFKYELTLWVVSYNFV